VRDPKFPLLALALLAASPLMAGTYADSISGASIEWEQVEFGVDYTGVPATLEMTRFTFSLMDLMHERFALGLRGGYLELTSADDPVLAGIDPHGGYLGVTAAGTLWQAGRFRVIAQGEFGYNYTWREDATDKTALRWTEGSLRLAGSFRAGPVELNAGAYSLTLRGRETSSSLALTRDFEAQDSSGMFGGVDLLLDDQGRIGVRLESGAREGFALVFARDF
jgi:hypothetical protein